ncbi:cellulose synthase complex periplasmic endoglucanase BcsZ [Serratia sp. UGAL515B_01]|uniref:cellulose synthase complex periplasmic endoglucanase BcsZ n=1 Tax=Serratia sp. UGAL515B_01 TaxID=2986763 RepID=UPI0029541DD9|nr:cellulose synthase complex periplasmic endoglucanase BcsZ [Serratia sp. UGAL515B_01]WON77083.1 cellulose synthase complex periplasmic endoglucanase BcsZ [Serratia sp. UGAL515B_01]
MARLFLKHFLPCLLLLCVFPIAASCEWPAWQQYKQFYISDEGRVIDPSSPQRITTSEGQSYGLFFALVANDRPTFDKLLTWTENNLAAGDLSVHLPAWLWGEDDKKNWKVLDSNSASDADLWIAYDLLEAGRLWQSQRYQTLGTLLLQRIGHEEVVDIPGLGTMLLPGKIGFVADNQWRLNPSYLPLQLLTRFSSIHESWKAVQKTSQRLWLETAPQGFSPDWVAWQPTKGWLADSVKPNIGSYDAIRVYLWAGMLADDDPHKAALVKQFQPMVNFVVKQGVPPEKMDTATGKATAEGPVGFSAALLPLLAEQVDALAMQRQRIKDNPLTNNAYFNASLLLFGQGWDQQRYRFNRQGELQPSWGGQCVTSD